MGGAIHLDVAVPQEGLPAGINVGSRAWAMLPTAFVDAPAAAVLATAKRVFPGDRRPAVHHHGDGATSVAARDARGAMVWEQPLNTGPDVHQIDLPLGTLRPGQHRLTVGTDRIRLASTLSCWGQVSEAPAPGSGLEAAYSSVFQ